ncbi:MULTISPECIES: response regulator transcription factor [Brucella/Ochrobactrum group]|uniref:Response regulator receiver protein n=1 Tax=Brucella anthropi (strain ATCC 49188 / DSM 6882 / CCUG 24695 / JCM 21032 / LMG 3331 / NBRC 15819 / NCTC 12168 / Alc 37) TaxID=439375 RepID=A6X8H1_BRUA4|nr:MULTISPECIES: LuxR family transcriptional regulator [Brucella/Ochrobactrum group]ABS17525.1 response regulator receiver protein [Brucella anthropi ATCC 49188]AIK41602.1 bacterial regulatory s, luxR family protein [Brucella anthropi]KAB2727857.1 helix-turn-helix transcriptional regulator [Brucella anthropi]KAB2746335.1 helix-turn-helix transcriptional regulator [Brucella anthropi]KAB2761635.1 helix-turn-helix transcriptional regulator [Brucella anthropi]
MNWAQTSARVIDALHQPHFPATLIEAIRSVVPFEHTVTFAYCGNRRPIALHSEFPVWKHKVMVEDYQEGPYLLDPFYLQSSRPGDPRLVRLRDMAPDRFYQGEYFRNYYVQTELAEEIGFMFNVEPNICIVISAMRTSKPFSAHEFRKLGELVPFIGAVGRHNWADLSKQFTQTSQQPETDNLSKIIQHAFRNLGRQILTTREVEVTEYILKGYSAEATAHALGISCGTVRIHRRNIYGKLHINSQGELFSRFISAMTGQDN